MTIEHSDVTEYQCRMRPSWSNIWTNWERCNKYTAQDYERNPVVHNWHWEVRRLYLHPQK